MLCEQTDTGMRSHLCELPKPFYETIFPRGGQSDPCSKGHVTDT